jgi:hypothetical protein
MDLLEIKQSQKPSLLFVKNGINLWILYDHVRYYGFFISEYWNPENFKERVCEFRFQAFTAVFLESSIRGRAELLRLYYVGYRWMYGAMVELDWYKNAKCSGSSP